MALGVAVAVYFALHRQMSTETVSWVCIIAAAPFAIAGFFRYQGMPLERFLWAWLRSEFLCAGRRLYSATNWLYDALKG